MERYEVTVQLTVTQPILVEVQAGTDIQTIYAAAVQAMRDNLNVDFLQNAGDFQATGSKQVN